MVSGRLAVRNGVVAAALGLLGVGSVAASGAPQVPAAATTVPPSSLPDALADALSGPLRLVGKGRGTGYRGA